MKELQAGIERSLAVLPQPAVLLQPGKATLDDPALGHYFERVQFTAFGNLYHDALIQCLAPALREGLAGKTHCLALKCVVQDGSIRRAADGGIVPRCKKFEDSDDGASCEWGKVGGLQ